MLDEGQRLQVLGQNLEFLPGYTFKLIDKILNWGGSGSLVVNNRLCCLFFFFVTGGILIGGEGGLLAPLPAFLDYAYDIK